VTNTNSTELLANIPPELRTPALWLMSKDKKPAETFKTAEDKAAHCRTLDRLLTRDNCVEVQRVVMKDEGLIYIDLDHVRNADTGETELWADNLIEELNTYTELSRSGTGYHLVCRGKLDEDFNLGPPSQVEIFSGNRPNKLMALTGNIMDPFHAGIEDRQELACALLKRVKRAGKVAGDVAFAAQVDWRTRFHRVDELPDGDIRFLIDDVLPEGVAFIGVRRDRWGVDCEYLEHVFPHGDLVASGRYDIVRAVTNALAAKWHEERRVAAARVSPPEQVPELRLPRVQTHDEMLAVRAALIAANAPAPPRPLRAPELSGAQRRLPKPLTPEQLQALRPKKA